MEHRQLSLLDSCIFTENDRVDSAPAVSLPRVRCAIFTSFCCGEVGEGVEMWNCGDHPDLKRSPGIFGL